MQIKIGNNKILLFKKYNNNKQEFIVIITNNVFTLYKCHNIQGTLLHTLSVEVGYIRIHFIYMCCSIFIYIFLFHSFLIFDIFPNRHLIRNGHLTFYIRSLEPLSFCHFLRRSLCCCISLCRRCSLPGLLFPPHTCFHHFQMCYGRGWIGLFSERHKNERERAAWIPD